MLNDELEYTAPPPFSAVAILFLYVPDNVTSSLPEIYTAPPLKALFPPCSSSPKIALIYAEPFGPLMNIAPPFAEAMLPAKTPDVTFILPFEL